MNRFFSLVAFVIVFAHLGTHAQCPENIGFESGTFKGWQTYTGEVNTQGIVSVSETTQPDPSRHVIMDATKGGLDPYGHFPMVSPNGSRYSVRLGNEDVGHQAERLSYTLKVPIVEQYSLILNYAVVLQNFNHTAREQPKFTVNIFNLTDNTIVDCPAFYFVASGNLPGFKESDVRPPDIRNAPVVYKDWSATTIDLSAYAGKEIRLELTTSDCIRENHFGYAYFDINENCGETISGNIYCAGQNAMTLQGPRGFAVYNWFKEGNITDVIGTGQTLKISPLPADGTKYILQVKPYQDIGCEALITTTIKKNLAPFSLKVIPEISFCQGAVINLKAREVTAGSSSNLVLEYLSDDVTQEYLRNADKLTQPGIYYIKATSPEGCSDILPVKLTYYNQVNLMVTDPAAVNYPATINLATTYVRDPSYQYFYFSDEKATIPVSDYLSVSKSGKYYIKAVSQSGCEKIAAVNVKIDPPKPYVIAGPTVFTPNGDGVNDRFNITITGFVDFGMLSIYNRTGQFLYKTNNINNSWEGSFNGRSLPAGTYYWLFEGTDQYYHTKVTKSGYVSIIK